MMGRAMQSDQVGDEVSKSSQQSDQTKSCR
jgi:hypothetical protein